MSEKIEDGDIKGAVRIASSDDKLATYNDENLVALQSKHPGPPPDSAVPPPSQPIPAQVNELDVAQAIRFFPNGSAGGPDRLRPQHIKDMLQSYRNEPLPRRKSALS